MLRGPAPAPPLASDATIQASELGPAVRRFARGVAWSVLGTAVGRGITLVASLVIARALGPASFGQWGVVQSTIGTASALAGLGSAVTATKYVAQHRNHDRQLAAGRATLALALAGGGGILLALALIVGADALGAAVFGSASFGNLLRFGAGALAFGTLNGAQVGVLTGLERFGSVCVMNVARGVAIASFMVTGAFLWGATGAVAGLSLGELVGAIAGAIAVQRCSRQAGIPLDLKLAWRERSILWRFSLPALFGSMAVQPAMWIGQIVLVRRPDGFAQAGYFAFGYRWYLFIMFFASAIAPIGLPILTNLRATATRDTHARFLRISFIINLAVVILPGVVVVLLAPELTQIGGSGYAAARSTLVVLAVACIPSAANTVLSQAALSLDRVRAWVVSDIVLAASLGGSAVVLTPRLGSVGLAFAYLIGMTATCVVLAGPTLAAVRDDRAWVSEHD